MRLQLNFEDVRCAWESSGRRSIFTDGLPEGRAVPSADCTLPRACNRISGDKETVNSCPLSFISLSSSEDESGPGSVMTGFTKPGSAAPLTCLTKPPNQTQCNPDPSGLISPSSLSVNSEISSAMGVCGDMLCVYQNPALAQEPTIQNSCTEYDQATEHFFDACEYSTEQSLMMTGACCFDPPLSPGWAIEQSPAHNDEEVLLACARDPSPIPSANIPRLSGNMSGCKHSLRAAVPDLEDEEASRRKVPRTSVMGRATSPSSCSSQNPSTSCTVLPGSPGAMAQGATSAVRQSSCPLASHQPVNAFPQTNLAVNLRAQDGGARSNTTANSTSLMSKRGSLPISEPAVAQGRRTGLQARSSGAAANVSPTAAATAAAIAVATRNRSRKGSKNSDLKTRCDQWKVDSEQRPRFKGRFTKKCGAEGVRPQGDQLEQDRHQLPLGPTPGPETPASCTADAQLPTWSSASSEGSEDASASFSGSINARGPPQILELDEAPAPFHDLHLDDFDFYLNFGTAELDMIDGF